MKREVQKHRNQKNAHACRMSIYSCECSTMNQSYDNTVSFSFTKTRRSAADADAVNTFTMTSFCSVLMQHFQLQLGKGKVFPYSLPSVRPGADPGVQAVSPQVT